MPLILSGSPAAQSLLERLTLESSAALIKRGRLPKLAVIQVGQNPASTSYIRQKQKCAETYQIDFEHHAFASDISESSLAEKILSVVARADIDSLLLQLPVDAPHLQNEKCTERLLNLIPPDKDADGLHLLNQGKLYTRESTPQNWTAPLPCTALGMMRLLEHYSISLMGKRATVVGTSRLVGMPTAALLSFAGATVTICHSKTKDLRAACKSAEILVVATGKAGLIRPDFITPGVTIIDVGISKNAAGKLVGDVDPSVYPLTQAYSPVPGGVGPMTVACLIENTIRLASRQKY